MLNNNELIQLFENLPRPIEDDRYFALSLPESPQHRIAKNSHCAPCFLLDTTKSTVGFTLVPSFLEHIAVSHNLYCQFKNIDGTRQEGHFSVIVCLSNDVDIQKYFIQVATPVIYSLSSHPTSYQINDALLNLGELFRALTRPPKQSTQGLWAELYVILKSKDPQKLVQSWRETPEDRLDFRLGQEAIEVKSYSGLKREHHFSPEQLRPLSEEGVLIVSLRTVKVDTGTRLLDLVDRIRSQLASHELEARMDRFVAVTLGSGLREGLLDKFDEQIADDSFVLFDSLDIPSIANDIPREIFNVRFSVDCSRVNRVLAGRFSYQLTELFDI